MAAAEAKDESADHDLRAARAVARSRGLFVETAGTINIDDAERATWQERVDEGSIETIRVSARAASAVVEVLGRPLYPPGAASAEDAPFIEVFARSAPLSRSPQDFVSSSG